LSITTRRPCKHQTPNYDCNQQKFLHDSPPDNFNRRPGGKFRRLFACRNAWITGNRYSFTELLILDLAQA
jgi:hypothetical protein